MISLVDNSEQVEQLKAITDKMESQSVDFVQKELGSILIDLENIVNAIKLYKNKKL